jgi:acyl dehydratase
MLFFEDLSLGDTFKTAEHTVTTEEIIAFGRQFDPQPFHTDAVAAQATLFGRIVASGWHTAALSMGLMVRGEMNLDGGVIGLGVDDLRWPRPVLPGDRLRVMMKIAELNPEPLRPGRGKIKLHCRTLNQDGKTVQEMTANLLIGRRPSTTEPATVAQPGEDKPAGRPT